MKIYFDQAMSAFRFQGVVRQVIHSFKYSKQFYWHHVLGAWIGNREAIAIDVSQVDLALPVPLHPVRERERGFNQAWVLLEAFGEAHGFSVERGLLKRIRVTETQANLDRQERLQNLDGAFAVSAVEKIQGKRILLLDDVLTTGSTASECSRVLKEAGAISVLVFTVARG